MFKQIIESFKKYLIVTKFYLYLNTNYNKILIGEKIMLEQYLPFMGLIVFGNIDDNSHAIGKKNKAVIGIKDNGIAEVIQKIINGGEA